jgi:hypothetical protein
MGARNRLFRRRQASFCNFIGPLDQKKSLAARWGCWNAYKKLAPLPARKSGQVGACSLELLAPLPESSTS